MKGRVKVVVWKRDKKKKIGGAEERGASGEPDDGCEGSLSDGASQRTLMASKGSIDMMRGRAGQGARVAKPTASLPPQNRHSSREKKIRMINLRSFVTPDCAAAARCLRLQHHHQLGPARTTTPLHATAKHRATTSDITPCKVHKSHRTNRL